MRQQTSRAERPIRFDGESGRELGERDAVLAIMMAIAGGAFAALLPRANLVVENLALRQQLAVLCRPTPRPGQPRRANVCVRGGRSSPRTALYAEACRIGETTSPRMVTVPKEAPSPRAAAACTPPIAAPISRHSGAIAGAP